MNNELTVQVYTNEEFGEIRTLEINGEPWFVGKDVAEKLGYTNTRKALVDHVDEDDKQIIQRSQNVTFEIPNRGLTIINESGLYSLILSSKLPNAKKFKKWITSEVLPSIRKTGSYGVPQLTEEQQKANLLLSIYNGGQEGVLAAKQLTELEIKPLLEKIENDKPLVAFADRIMNKGENILVRELAKIISDEGYSIGEKRLYKQLREWGYIFQNSTEPTQRAIDNGYFVRITRMIKTAYGEKETFTTKVTPKGQIRITERILKENNL